MRAENLTTVKGGLNRLRTKGAALKDSLHTLTNGYVTTEKTVKVRPGTLLSHTLPSGTVGLVALEGKFHVFASSAVVGLDEDNFEVHYVRSPASSALTKIHFAERFLGALYVSAEFANGNIYHYWLQVATTWAPDTMYLVNQLVSPTIDNTYFYRATRLNSPYPVWTPNTPRSVGDKFEPTAYNGLYFEVIATVGANPRSGATEPDFDVALGTILTENTDGTDPLPDPTPVDMSDYDIPVLDDKYRPTWAAHD